VNRLTAPLQRATAPPHGLGGWEASQALELKESKNIRDTQNQRKFFEQSKKGPKGSERNAVVVGRTL